MVMLINGRKKPINLFKKITSKFKIGRYRVKIVSRVFEK